MKKESELAYKLKLGDFIPITGLIGHNKRSLNERENYPESFYTEEYTSQFYARSNFLKAYNGIIIGGIVLTGLAELFSK